MVKYVILGPGYPSESWTAASKKELVEFLEDFVADEGADVVEELTIFEVKKKIVPIMKFDIR